MGSGMKYKKALHALMVLWIFIAIILEQCCSFTVIAVYFISLRKKLCSSPDTSCMFFFSFSNVYVLLQSFTFFNQRYCVIENNRELMCFFVVHCFFLFSFCFILLFSYRLFPSQCKLFFLLFILKANDS